MSRNEIKGVKLLLYSISIVVGKGNAYAWWTMKYKFQWFCMSWVPLYLHLKLAFHNVKIKCKVYANNLKFQITNKKQSKKTTTSWEPTEKGKSFIF